MDGNLTTGDLALMRDNDGFGNNGFFWVFALLILMFGGNGGFGWGNNKLRYISLLLAVVIIALDYRYAMSAIMVLYIAVSFVRHLVRGNKRAK